MLRELRKSGHSPTLAASFLYFDVSFMVWVLLGPLGPFMGEALKLSAAQKGLLAAIPLLGGSFFRPILGWMTEGIGGRRTGLTGLAVTLIPLLAGWKFARSFPEFLLVGALLGIAGASFAVALPLVSAWYPPRYQGLVMGIAGAGNTGTLLATLFAPRLANSFGWHNVFGLAMIPVGIVWTIFFVMAKDAPGRRAVKLWREFATIFREADAGWFCFLYSLTFGGFAGLASYLPIFFHDQYGLSKIGAGDYTTVAVVFGSFLRPVGGLLSDRFGGYRILVGLLGGGCACLAAVSVLPPLNGSLLALAAAVAMLGMGNGSVFQLVPQRFPERVGIVTGVVGAAGGLGGFLLPSTLGVIKDRTGSFGTGFAVLSLVAITGMVSLVLLGRVWRRTWTPESASRAGIRKVSTKLRALNEAGAVE